MSPSGVTWLLLGERRPTLGAAQARRVPLAVDREEVVAVRYSPPAPRAHAHLGGQAAPAAAAARRAAPWTGGFTLLQHNRIRQPATTPNH